MMNEQLLAQLLAQQQQQQQQAGANVVPTAVNPVAKLIAEQQSNQMMPQPRQMSPMYPQATDPSAPINPIAAEMARLHAPMTAPLAPSAGGRGALLKAKFEAKRQDLGGNSIAAQRTGMMAGAAPAGALTDLGREKEVRQTAKDIHLEKILQTEGVKGFETAMAKDDPERWQKYSKSQADTVSSIIGNNKSLVELDVATRKEALDKMAAVSQGMQAFLQMTPQDRNRLYPEFVKQVKPWHPNIPEQYSQDYAQASLLLGMKALEAGSKEKASAGPLTLPPAPVQPGPAGSAPPSAGTPPAAPGSSQADYIARDIHGQPIPLTPSQMTAMREHGKYPGEINMEAQKQFLENVPEEGFPKLIAARDKFRKDGIYDSSDNPSDPVPAPMAVNAPMPPAPMGTAPTQVTAGAAPQPQQSIVPGVPATAQPQVGNNADLPEGYQYKDILNPKETQSMTADDRVEKTQRPIGLAGIQEAIKTAIMPDGSWNPEVLKGLEGARVSRRAIPAVLQKYGVVSLTDPSNDTARGYEDAMGDALKSQTLIENNKRGLTEDNSKAKYADILPRSGESTKTWLNRVKDIEQTFDKNAPITTQYLEQLKDTKDHKIPERSLLQYIIPGELDYSVDGQTSPPPNLKEMTQESGGPLGYFNPDIFKIRR